MSDPAPPRPIVSLTAGGAGMYCGSCLHDNTLARALQRLGQPVLLVPTYTPIRTDEEDVSLGRVFFGGLNVYLQQKSALFRKLPDFLDRWLDQPWLIRALGSFGIQTSAGELGELTVSMLRGEDGRQSREVRKLVDWLAEEIRPALVNLSNILIGGCIPAIKRRLRAPVLVTLQGDDIFLDGLAEPWRTQAHELVRGLVREVDGFIVHSQYYRELVATRYGAPRERIDVVPLGVDGEDLAPPFGSTPAPPRPPTVGYLARVAPEKGFHLLIEAVLALRRRRPELPLRLRAAGWLGAGQRGYLEAQRRRLRDAGCEEILIHDGEVDRGGKRRFLASIDLLCVPTTYREPKGLFALEAMAAGVPVLEPDHGAFPELIADTGGGRLFPAGDAERLADALAELLTQPEELRRLGETGRRCVAERRSAAAMARATLAVYRRYLEAAR